MKKKFKNYKRGEGEKIAAAFAAAKQAQAKSDAAKAEAGFLAVQAKAEHAKKKEVQTVPENNKKKMKIMQKGHQNEVDTLILS